MNKEVTIDIENPKDNDLISRQTVQDYIAKYLSQYLYNDVREAVEVIDEYIGELPSVKPQEKTGHWIELGCVGNDNYNFECSECHHTDTQSKAVKVNYCWYCGARMFEPQESEVWDEESD